MVELNADHVWGVGQHESPGKQRQRLVDGVWFGSDHGYDEYGVSEAEMQNKRANETLT
jgi:hypothetical protein